MLPSLLDHPKVLELFPAEAVERARATLNKLKGGMGAYSDSRGSLDIRTEVASFIQKRDGLPKPTNPDHIFLTDGASVGVRSMLSALIRDARDGVLVPIPQYPLYSASIALYGGSLVPYSLDESKGWSLDVSGMAAAVAKGRASGVNARALVFINPGNPTGQCLPESNIRELCKFAYDNKIVLMADEVYQENIYQDKTPFVSARKVLHGMGEPYASGVELVSFHTVSKGTLFFHHFYDFCHFFLFFPKGTLGECGLRGGYFEMHNIDQGTVDEIYKVASINLSPNTVGQAAMSLMVNPPAPGTEARKQQDAEKAAILASLRRRAHMMTDAFNSLEGVTCTFTEGAMYSFPQVRFSPKALVAAKAAGKAPDVFYCLALVEETGISTVPGSGFGQEPGTYHLRTTILPQEAKMVDVVQRLKKFHAEFVAKYK